jgi:hypothetical protein
MSDFLYYIGAGYLLWCLFLAVISLKDSWKELSITVKVMSLPIVGVALVVDVLFNIVSSFVFADIPREFMFTSRLQRYIATGDGWRYVVAKWICRELLDPFDSGHC